MDLAASGHVLPAGMRLGPSVQLASLPRGGLELQAQASAGPGRAGASASLGLCAKTTPSLVVSGARGGPGPSLCPQPANLPAQSLSDLVRTQPT